MAIFDPVEQRMVVRVVYDGLAWAGKTTNLSQLSLLFAAQGSTKLYSPADMNGRTLYFDWLQISAGAVCGFPLLCQVVSVPGQVVLTPRRRHLLATADVIVYVCESSEASIDAARAGLGLYDELAAQRGAPIPLVIQANKQDQVGAIDGASLARALGREGVPAVEGIATEGVGVVDTFITAVRTVARALTSRSESGTLSVEVRRAETAAEALSRVTAARMDPEWAAEMLLEEAQGIFTMAEAARVIATDADERAHAAAAARELTHVTPEAAAAEAPRDPAAAAPRAPSLPSADVPTGYIWPAHTGRATLTTLGIGGAAETDFDARGVLVHQVQGHIARTTKRAHYKDGEAARQALVRAARDSTQLERLLVPETVLVAQSNADGTCLVWTVRPKVSSIADLLVEKSLSPELLSAYGTAAVEVVRAALRGGFSAEFSPEAFGVQQGMLRYIGELWPVAPTSARMSSSIATAIDALTALGADSAMFLEAFDRAIQRRLTPEERAVVARPTGVA